MTTTQYIAAPLYRAKFETIHFSFEAYGIDPEQAIEALRGAWAQHCTEYTAADPDYLEEYSDDIRIYAIAANTSFRDTEQLTGKHMPVDFEMIDGEPQPVT